MSTAVAPSLRKVRWPWLVVAWFFTMATVASLFVLANGGELLEQVTFILAFGMFGIVGALVVSRMPGNRVGVLLLYGSGVTATAFLAGELVTFLVDRGISDGPVVVALGVVSTVFWIVGILPVLILLPMVFPDGRLPSRRWRPVAWLTFAVLGVLFIWVLLGERVLTGSIDVGVDNPFYVPAIGEIEISDGAVSIALLLCLVGSVASLVVRFRRARGVERQQVKWVALSTLFIVFSFILSEVLIQLGADPGLADALVSGLAFLSLPVAIGVAVLQYRLYELDVVVKKTLVAGALVLLVIAIYGGLVALFGAVASGRESSASLFVVALLLGFAFRPVARFARKLADRLVYGRRATPYEVLTEFSERVGDAYATDDVLERMAQILGQAVGATSARVWLLVGGELRPASSWPADAPPAEAVPVRGDGLPELVAEAAVEVRDAGELLGALSVVMPPNDPMTPAKERLVHDLAGQAGLVLRNVRLVEELRGSHRRLVTAQDAERRRIERNIHDGAQQQLVALAVKARLARGLGDRDPGKMDELLAQIEEELQTALGDLRDLARGIYPPLLADQGLAAALEAQARRSAVPVTLQAEGLGRYPQEVEAAVYFSCLEALQNVAKYAEAHQATVTLAQDDGHLTFEVADDGRGFDPRATGYGTGLRGMADRLSALHGNLTVRSEPGGGTRVSGRVEVGA